MVLPVLLLSGGVGCAQDDPARALERALLLKSGVAKDRALKAGFEAALASHPAVARRYLPWVIGRPWVGEMDFRHCCALARMMEKSADGVESALAGRLVLASGLRHPSLALRESAEYLPLAQGRRLFERFALASPAEAMGLASGNTRPARRIREMMSCSGSGELAFLARLAGESAIDLPRRERVAVFAGRMARGELSFESALKIAENGPRFFAAVMDMRAGAGGAEADSLERVLERESLLLCRAARENLPGALAGDLARFRVRDLYAMLALGRAEASPAVFSGVFDRLLWPRLAAETPKGASLIRFLDEVKNWGLRDFAAGALAARRFEGLFSIAGGDIASRLFHRLDESPDPLKEAVRLAGIVDAVTGAALRRRMASSAAAEYARCRDAGDAGGTVIYGLLAARLSVDAIAAPYVPFFRSSESLDTASLFGRENTCVERHFFYDDDDGVASFRAFRKSYEGSRTWKVEDRGRYVRIVGEGAAGRRLEIFANVPIDSRLPKNRPLEGEARRRQQVITAVLEERGLTPSVVVHRGHSFWVEQTLAYVTKSTRLAVLGGCGGTSSVHAVIEASHDAHVIATRGTGDTGVNDGILKRMNERILLGERVLRWSRFWEDLRADWGRSAAFRDYVAPHQDPSAVFLRAYYGFLDASN